MPVHRQRLRVRRWWWAWVMLLVLGTTGAAGAHDEIARSPYGLVARDLLAHVHALEMPCDLTLDPGTRCFTIEPGTVAAVAEALEDLVTVYGGALARSEWRSANGVHHVELRLSDDLWGALEMWLTEPGGQVVAGRLWYLPKRRSNGL